MLEVLLNFGLWLMSGVALGWLAFALINANARYPLLLNMLVGGSGAVAAGALLHWNPVNPPALCFAPLGALLALTLLSAVAAHRSPEKTRILLH